MALHTGFAKHKRVLVTLKNGQQFVDRWAGKTDNGKSIRLEGREEPIRLKAVRNISIYKPAPHEREDSARRNNTP